MASDIQHDEFQMIGTDYAVRKLRGGFFTALDELHPEARTELYEIWEWYREDFERLMPELTHDRERLKAEAEEHLEIVANERGLALYDPDPVNSILGPLLDARRGPSTYPVIAKVVADLNAWADTHRMSCDWVLDTACRMIAAWDDQPPDDYRTVPWWTLGEGLCAVGIWSPLSPEEATCSIHFELEDAWKPPLESKADAKKRVVKAFKSDLDRWLDDTESVAKKNGFKPPLNTRQEDTHLRWLVRFQIKQQTAMEIFNDPTTADCDLSKPEKAITRMAEKIGLPKTPRRSRTPS